MTTPKHEAAESGLLKKWLASEPVVAGYIVAWVLTNAGALLLGHTHLVTSQQWSDLSTALAPVFTAIVLGALAWVTRHFVSPVIKKINGLL